ncbi:MAG: hypothetical protein ABIH23_15060 [bacterium]
MNEQETMVTGDSMAAELEKEGVVSLPGEPTEQATEPATTTAIPKEGDKRTEDGKEQVFDGKEWKEPVVPKEGETRQTGDKWELFDGKEWKPTTAPVTPWKDGEKEYTPEQLREAIKSHNDFHALMSGVKQKSKDVAKIEAALDPAFKLTELLAKDSSMSSALRDALEAAGGEEAAKLLDQFLALKKSGLQDPREQEFAEREKVIAEKEATIHYNEVIKKMTKDNKFTPEELKEFEDFIANYYTRMEAENLPFLEPEDLYVKSPLYRKKIEAETLAKAEKIAAEKAKKEKEAADLEKNNPPKTQIGAGGEVKEDDWESVKKNIEATAPQT